MELVDSRRLTGLNLHDASPGALAQVRFAPGEDAEAALGRWRASLSQGLHHLGWDAVIHIRRMVDADRRPSAELMFTCTVDCLYAATDLNEWAIGRANEPERDADAGLRTIAQAAATERAGFGCALTLIEHAGTADVPWLIDDERLSLGYGRRSQTWELSELVGSAQHAQLLGQSVQWEQLGRIPVGLITGTNGKTTTSRWLARMARLSGQTVGNTSTDGIYVNETLVQAGDWTGPGAARELLRMPDLDVAILEAARGGLLRRGLEVLSCDAALITNVERDHMGEYGIHTLADMAAVKGLVAQAVRPGGRIVLGADSPALVEWAAQQTFAAQVEWVCPDPDDPQLVAHAKAGGTTWTEHEGYLVRRDGLDETRLVRVADVPMSFGGRARHNVANALGAAALGRALGIDPDAIVGGLLEFGSRESDNPGRAQTWSLPGGPDVLIDFAHNLAGLSAMAQLVRELHRPTLVCFGMAGDRSDEDLRSLGASMIQFRPKRVILREQPDYLRGRSPGEVPALLAQALEAQAPQSHILQAADETSSLDAALGAAEPGDLIVLLVHTEREAVAAWLRRAGATLIRV